MNHKNTPSIPESVSNPTVLSHPGITIEKNLVSFTEEARAALTVVIENVLLELAEAPSIEGTHPEALQRVTDRKIGEILATEGATVNVKKGLLGRVGALMKGKATPAEKKEVLSEVIEKDPSSNSKSIYLQIDGQLFVVPIIVWRNKADLPLKDFTQELIAKMNARAKLGGILQSKGGH